jgi:hypothetical protein
MEDISMLKRLASLSTNLMKARIQCWLIYGIAIAIAFAGLTGCGSDNSDAPLVQIKTLSNRADLISGGDALMEIVLPSGASVASLKVDVDGRDVSSAFAMRSNGRITGVVTGFINGNNIVSARADGARSANLTVTNYPRGGPVLLGSQLTPWVCATPVPVNESGNTPQSNASGLKTTAVDAQCNIATEFKLFYRTKTPVLVVAGDGGCSFVLPDPTPTIANPNPTTPANSCFQPYDPATTSVSLVASTTTTDGLTVPYVVRVERGTLNRGIYDIAVLFDTTKSWTATAPQVQWNGKVLYSFGASTGQPRLQFRSEQNWADNDALSRGFIVVDNSLTDSLYNSNRILTSETAMMMKEYIIDNYGEIKYVMGNGGSGGAIGQNTTASTLPGLLDGIQPSFNFPDSITCATEVSDCVLLANAYLKPQWTALMTGLTAAQINAKKTAINGHKDQTACHGWYNLFGSANKPGNYVPLIVYDNTTGAIMPSGASRNNCMLPAALVYDPVTNPTGTRCTDPDNSAAVWGKMAGIAAGSTRALFTNDNVGVQYGFKALLNGNITPEEFITLNEIIGGTDTDSNPIAARSQADSAALDIAYKSGIVSSGKHLAQLPIIDAHGYDEVYNLTLGQYGIHQYWRSFSERARIDTENGGNHGNQLLFRYANSLTTAQQNAQISGASFLMMDTWLSSLVTSAPKAWLNAERTQAQVIAAKPAEAKDKCYLSSDTTFSTPIYDMAVCDADAQLVKHASPHQVAGSSLNEDILKCQLKPLVFSDYTGITVTAAQAARLQAVFPGGVCDWSKSGVGQQDPVSPQTYKAGPGGQPLSAAPVSTAK